MILLAVDPSSTRTGYAVFSGGKLAEAGALRPNERHGAVARIVELHRELLGLITEAKPTAAVIEIPSGHVARRLARPAGLSVYGMAAGALWLTMWQQVGPAEVTAVDENTWTGGVPKAIRQQRIAAEFPAYRAAIAADGGADVADAIGLGQWWHAQRIVQELRRS